ncbi:MAG: RsmD family RNA methyltransferase, partial [Pirellulales bacterium]|nr:RsmD family RNA methyltransferase [Pirellulales bacterium]
MTPKTKIAQHGSGAFQKKTRRGQNEMPADAASPPRIIGGDLKGRRLAFRPGGPTRPMKDRVRAVSYTHL